MTLRARLSLLSLGLLLGLLLAGGAVQYVVEGVFLQRDAASQLSSQYASVMGANPLLPARSAASLRGGCGALTRPAVLRQEVAAAGAIPADYADCLARWLSGPSTSVVVLSPAGDVLAAQPADDAPSLPLLDYTAAAQRGALRNHWVAAAPSGAESVVVLRLLKVGTRTVGIVQLGVPTSVYEATRSTLLLVLALATAGLMLVAAVVTPLLVGRELRPLRRVTEASGAIAAGDLARRVEETPRGDELGALARAFNRMAAAVQAAFSVRSESEGRMRRFVADASHELRTPLTTVQGHIDLLRRGAGEDPEARRRSLEAMGRETQRMAALVEDLLTLTRLESAAGGEGAPALGPVDLNRLVAETVEEQSVRAPQQRVELQLQGGGAPLWVAGDRDQLRRVILNLAGNALKYAPGGVHTWRTWAGGGMAHASLADQGPGIPEPDLPRIFDRFYRGAAAAGAGAGGTGLGLAIVRSVAQAHGGGAEVANNPGGGATFSISLPAASPPPLASDLATDPDPAPAAG